MSMHKEYITQAKKDELEAELAVLQTTERQNVLKALEYAKGLGDLKENAEYHEAREAQGKLEDRIKKIEHILKHAEIIVEGQGFEQVMVGATVDLVNVANGEEKTFKIVGPEEVDVLAGKISHTSPLGIVLLGKKTGDEVTFNSPRGETVYKIIEIK